MNKPGVDRFLLHFLMHFLGFLTCGLCEFKLFLIGGIFLFCFFFLQIFKLFGMVRA